MPPITQPVAGSTHHLVLKYGPPSSPTYQGLMLPDGDLKKYIVQPYTPFAPQSRQGNATIQDFSVATVWELNADWSGGTGHTRERKAESSVYAYAQGNNVTGGLGTTLFTAQKGKLLPAPAHANANVGGAIAAGNIKQFIEFKSRLYGLTDENPGKIYQWDSGGTTPTLKLTLSATTAYTATAGHISFTAATKTITDSDNGLGFLKLGDTFSCTGTSSNPGPFTVATEGTGSVGVNETVVNETPAGAVAFVLPATTGIKMTTDGNKLWITRGTRKPMSTSDGTTWNNETVAITNPDFYDFGNAGPGATDQAFQIGTSPSNAAKKCNLVPYTTANGTFIGWNGTAATNCAFFRESIVIGKPEGLYAWHVNGVVECIFPCFDAVDPVNFSKMAVHNDLLWFNFKNRLFFTDLRTVTEVYPEDRGGFTAITSLTGTTGPLLIGAKWQAVDAASTFQGPRSVTNPATSLVNDAGIGTVAWTTPSNAGVSDDIYATAALNQSQATNWLKASNFGFNIPPGAAITGIVVEIEKKAIDTWTVNDGAVALFVGSSLAGLPKGVSNWGTSDAYLAYGSLDDLWESLLTPSDINSAGFNVRMYAVGLQNGVTAYVDHIRITVYYTVGGNPQNALFMLDSVQDAGLNPLWTDVDGSNPMYAAYATSAPDASASRVYTCSDHANWKVRYIDLDTRFLPRSYDTNATIVSYINLTEFSSGFASVKKWWYECVLNTVNPSNSTLAKVFYSIDGANFTQTLDQTGAAVEHTLNTRSLGSYFPLDTTGTYNQLRLSLRTTASTGASAITTVTLRGDVIVKPRYQFQFPVDCSETVQPLQGVAENGNVIWKNLRSASQYDYPCKLQDPEGNWHLVLFRTSPYFAAVDYRVPNGGSKLVPYGTVTIVLEEIDALASDGSYAAWQAG